MKLPYYINALTIWTPICFVISAVVIYLFDLHLYSPDMFIDKAKTYLAFGLMMFVPLMFGFTGWAIYFLHLQGIRYSEGDKAINWLAYFNCKYEKRDSYCSILDIIFLWMAVTSIGWALFILIYPLIIVVVCVTSPYIRIKLRNEMKAELDRELGL